MALCDFYNRSVLRENKNSRTGENLGYVADGPELQTPAAGWLSVSVMNCSTKCCLDERSWTTGFRYSSSASRAGSLVSKPEH